MSLQIVAQLSFPDYKHLRELSYPTEAIKYHTFIIPGCMLKSLFENLHLTHPHKHTHAHIHRYLMLLLREACSRAQLPCVSWDMKPLGREVRRGSEGESWRVGEGKENMESR